MELHTSTFQYFKPTDEQMEDMQTVRDATDTYARVLMDVLPDGPDKTYIIRSLRSLAMWNNVCITREADGEPRE